MRIYLETGNTARVGARSGIPTVVRGLLSGLDSMQCDVHPVRWSFNEAALTPLKPKWELNLDRPGAKKSLLPLSSLSQSRAWPLWIRTMGMDYKAPVHLHPAHRSKLEGSWLILPELLQGPHIRQIADYARKHGMRVAGIFYDAIPWLHPELVLHRTASEHAEYMSALAGLDAVIAISNQSARDFTDFARLKNLPPPSVFACNLAAQISDQPRETKLKEGAGDVIKVLYVSTLEPRKNHLLLMAAFEDARLRLGGIDIELHLVGGSYKEAPGIAEAVRAAAKKDPKIFWHENVGPVELRHFFRDSDFTIFASSIEGFGLPVTESLWFGRPCLCSNEGVMAENAQDGGCLTVNMRDQKEMADGIVKLASQPEFRRELGGQVLQRKLKTWGEYAHDVLQVLKGI